MVDIVYPFDTRVKEKEQEELDLRYEIGRIWECKSVKVIPIERQCGPVVRALTLRSGDPGFKTRSDHSLNLILVVPGSTSQLHL